MDKDVNTDREDVCCNPMADERRTYRSSNREQQRCDHRRDNPSTEDERRRKDANRRQTRSPRWKVATTHSTSTNGKDHSLLTDREEEQDHEDRTNTSNRQINKSLLCDVCLNECECRRLSSNEKNERGRSGIVGISIEDTRGNQKETFALNFNQKDASQFSLLSIEKGKFHCVRLAMTVYRKPSLLSKIHSSYLWTEDSPQPVNTGLVRAFSHSYRCFSFETFPRRVERRASRILNRWMNSVRRREFIDRRYSSQKRQRGRNRRRSR